MNILSLPFRPLAGIRLLLLLPILSLSAWAAQPDRLLLDGEWEFTYAPTAGEIPNLPSANAYVCTIKVPGWWDEQLDRMRKAPWFAQAEFRETQGPVKYLAGIGWHRKTFKAPEAWRGRAVTLTIGRAITVVHVWLNGRPLARYDYGVYTPFEVDLSGHLAYGKRNELVISVDNTRGFAGGWAYLGNQGRASGISESVSIDAAPGPGRLADLFIRPGQDLTEVEWNTELHVPADSGSSAPSSLTWEVWDQNKKKRLDEGRVEVPAFEKTHHLSWRARVDGIQPWSDRHPNLYWTRSRWVSAAGETWDQREQRFGLRRFSLDGRKLLLNGKPIYLRGSFGHYYHPIHCSPPTGKEYWQDCIRRLKNLGFNYINFAAEVCPRGMLEAADEAGMILQCGDHETVLASHASHYEGVWKPILRWTRSHPSLCIYGFGGERDYYEGIIEQYRRQHDLIKQLNPEALIMPQQAIRGIDYSFDSQGAKELTRKPFPHHAERLARYTEACDLFGHYSGGALSYTHDRPPTWQGMDERFRIYRKPLSAHELFMGASHLDPKNAARYTGRVPPYLYDETRSRLRAAGLLEKWPLYYQNSVRLQSICAKYNLEKVRKCHELVAFELLGTYDMHFLPYYTVGLLDEFMNFKSGNDARSYRRFNTDNVLLIDYDNGESINRAYHEGDRFEADALFSIYGEDDLDEGTFTWTLSHDGKVAQSGSIPVKKISTGGVVLLGRVELSWPKVRETTRFKLSFNLKGDINSSSNDWEYWVFPRREAPLVTAAADEKCLPLLTKRYAGLAPLTESSLQRLHIVSRLTAAGLAHLQAGGDVLLLGTEPFPVNKGYNSFRSGLGDAPNHNIGTVLAKHPVFSDLPHDGWADWHFYHLLDGTWAFLIDDVAMGGFSPILEVISPASHVRKQAAIFERRVGNGRLLASSCATKMDNPACVALLDGMIRYVNSDKFQPTLAMDLDAETLAEYAAAPPAKDPNNYLPESFFDRRGDVLSTWQPHGAGFDLDRRVAHSGRGSLRLQRLPGQLKAMRGTSVGATTTVVKFDPQQRLRLAAWCRTDQLSGEPESEREKKEKLDRDFQISVMVNYADGTRGTLRMPLPGGTHDWQLVETYWKLEKELNPDQSPAVCISLAGITGTAWLDDIYLGPAAAEK